MLSLIWRVTRVLILGAAAAAGVPSPPNTDAQPQADDEQKVEASEPAPGMLQIHVTHSLPRADAHKRIEKLVLYWGKFGIQGAWDGDSAKLSGAPLGVEVKAEVQVADQSVDGTVKDPGPLLRDRAVGYVQWKVARYLDPETPFESLP
jgi:hypothetical protein